MPEETRAYAQDRPPTELERLHSEIQRAHEMFTTLEARLAPVLHGLDNRTVPTDKAVLSSHHITQAVSGVEALITRIANVSDNLAV